MREDAKQIQILEYQIISPTRSTAWLTARNCQRNGRSLLAIFIENATKKDSYMSKLDRKLAKRNAEVRNRVGVLRDMRDDPALREKTPNVSRFMHRPRPRTAPDRKDLQSAGSNFAPDDELDLEDYDDMNGAAIPNLVHVEPPISARPMTGMPHRTLSTRGSILLTNRGAQSPDGDYGETLPFPYLVGMH
jgi:hypothetical protein